MRTDPFRELERLTHHVLGTATGPGCHANGRLAGGDHFVIELDLLGVSADAIDIDVGVIVVTVKAEPAEPDRERPMLAWERPHGLFNRQLFLGDSLGADPIHAEYTDGVPRLTVPVAAEAKPKRIAINTSDAPQASTA